jgi:hypothetical protein
MHDKIEWLVIKIQELMSYNTNDRLINAELNIEQRAKQL